MRALARSGLGLARSTHPFPIAVVVVMSGVVLVVAHRGVPAPGELTRALVVVLLSQIPIGALNDYIDRDADARTQPEKPIPSGEVAARPVLVLTVVSLIGFVCVAATFGPLPFALIAVGTACGLLYDVWLKPTPLSFIGYIGGFTALVAWLWAIAGHLTPLVVAILPLGAALLVAAHLAQSYPDIEGDRVLGSRGLAVVLGPRMTLATIGAAAALVTAIALAADVVARSTVAALLTSAAAVSIGAALFLETCYRFTSRDRLFRLVAPGLALLAVGCLLELASLSGL